MREFNDGEFLERNKRPLALIAGLHSVPYGGASRSDFPGYKELHLHPEVYDRVWGLMAESLPEDCRTVVLGRAALQHPATGLLLAVAFGTHYILRAPLEVVEGLKADVGNFVRRVNSNSYPIDLREVAGPDWVFGRFLDAEVGWCNASYRLAGGERAALSP